jgi:HAD superfamily phosphatase
MDRLAIDHQLAIFSGRPRAELQLTLSRFIPDNQWRATVGAEDVANKKPAPDGLLAIAAAHKGGTFTYVGDNVDDARCARAAGVRFIGVAGNRAGTCELLQAEGAVAVIENINQLEEVL